MWRRHAATWYGLRCGGVPRTGVVRLLRTRWGSLAPPAAPLSAAWVATEHSRMSLAVCVSTRRRTYDRHRAESQMNRVDHAAALEDGKVIPPSTSPSHPSGGETPRCPLPAMTGQRWTHSSRAVRLLRAACPCVLVCCSASSEGPPHFVAPWLRVKPARLCPLEALPSRSLCPLKAFALSLRSRTTSTCPPRALRAAGMLSSGTRSL